MTTGFDIQRWNRANEIATHNNLIIELNGNDFILEKKSGTLLGAFKCVDDLYIYLTGYDAGYENGKIHGNEEDDPLWEFSQSGVLPLIISKNGDKGEPIEEVITCTSIAGKARYENDMPQFLSLTKKLKNGNTFRAFYAQEERLHKVKI